MMDTESLLAAITEGAGRAGLINKQHCVFALALGVTVGLAILMLPALQAQTYSESVLYSFTGGADGQEPLFSGVVRDSAGNFYGTTISGGASNLGTVFKLDTSGNETVLHSFAGGSDGQTPASGLVIDAAGNLYGTATNGGQVTQACPKGCGVVFEVDGSGSERILHHFMGAGDGALPVGALLRDAAGNLYGTTQMGGTSRVGTVFKIDTAGVETVLYSFAGQPDAQNPYAGVIRDSAGNLYGTTTAGGTFNYGTVFKLDTSGHETVLYSFQGGSDGSSPLGGLVRDNRGNLYGTTFAGGRIYGLGTVFKVDANGNETILHVFNGRSGKYPESTLIRDSQGNLYGNAIQGGSADYLGGTVFKVTPNGTGSVLYDFLGGSDGGSPDGPLLMDSAGNIYGTTASGGTTGSGTVFKLTVTP